MSLISAVKSLFGFSGVGESALKIVDKIAGTDWTPEQKADWILRYQEATKHQSVTRRFIALSVALAWLLLVLSWLVSAIIGHASEIQGGIALANATKEFMSSNVNIAFNALLSFYFLLNFKK